MLIGTRRVGWGSLPLAAWLFIGCAGGGAGHKTGLPKGMSPRDTRILHEDCPLDEGVPEDVNGDGRPDRTTVSDGGKPVCRGLDFNFDGVIDTWVYLDATGAVRRRESDYDRDGRADEVALYQANSLVERQRATSLSGKLDTWQHYQNGRLASAERDSNGDDYVDQWWEYPDQRAAECPLIHSDVNGDGRPDPGATVDVCKQQYVPAARDGEQAPSADPSFTDVPTEVDQTSSPPAPGAVEQTAPGDGAGGEQP